MKKYKDNDSIAFGALKTIETSLSYKFINAYHTYSYMLIILTYTCL